MKMDIVEKIRVYNEGLERGLEMAISRAGMVVNTLKQRDDEAVVGWPQHGAQEVVDELKELKERMADETAYPLPS